jgi:ABC-type Zn uptake system ZnuABC Zn-binding protein ZnuA
MTKFDKEKIVEQLESLKNLPQIKEVKSLRKRLEKELEKLADKIKPEIAEIPKEQRQIQANIKRSGYMKKKWNYIRQLYANYPEIRKQYGLRDIFQMYSKRKKGQKIPIGDVYWQNPSQ